MGLNKILKDLPRSHDGRPLLCWTSKLDGSEISFADYIGRNAIRANLPGPIDLRPQLPPVFDQRNRGSCVAEGSVGMKAYQELLQGDYPSDGLSIPYVYTRCKQMDGYPDSEGTDPKTAMTVLQQYGVCPEYVMPRSTLLALPAPRVPTIPPGADAAASMFKIGSPACLCSHIDVDRSQLLAVIRSALATRGVFPLAFFVCSNFQPDGNYMLPLPSGTIEGGHQIAIAGDLPDKQALIVRNSWGPDWGDNGYAYLPYSWLTHQIDMTGNGDMMWSVFAAWTSVDQQTPPPGCKEFYMWPDRNYAVFDGVQVALDQPAVVNPRTNRTVVPLRMLCERFGYSVDWNQEYQEIHGYK